MLDELNKDMLYININDRIIFTRK